MTKKNKILKKIIFGVIGTAVLFIIIVIINLIIVEHDSSVVSRGKPIADYSEANYALLIIDIQEATTGDVSTDQCYKNNSDDLIRNINQLTERFNNQNIPIIYIRSEITNPLINLINNSYEKGSPGAAFDKRLKIVSALEVVKDKEDSFRDTDLDSILTGNKVNELYIMGLDAANCVNSTIKAAQNRNYRVNLIEETVLSKSKEMKDSMMVSFRNRGVNVISMDSLNIID
jgi:nicotinamidase-related amidase